MGNSCVSVKPSNTRNLNGIRANPLSQSDTMMERHNIDQVVDDAIGLASNGRDLGMTDNLDSQEDGVVLDSEGKVLEDIAADSKLSKIDFCEEILDEQFEYHQHMKLQDVLELEIVQ